MDIRDGLFTPRTFAKQAELEKTAVNPITWLLNTGKDVVGKTVDVGVEGAKVVGSAVPGLSKWLTLAALITPPAIGYGIGKTISSMHDPTEADFEALRRERLRRITARYAERAEQITRQILGEGD